MKIFVTNLGKYNEGELVGEWVELPITREKREEVFRRIGIGSTDQFGQPYEEWFITDYDSEIDGLTNGFGEYESLNELNYLGSILNDLKGWEVTKLEAIIESGLEMTSSPMEMINLVKDMDSFIFYEDVSSDYELGEYLIPEFFDTKIMGHLENYIDYEAFGRDYRLETESEFVAGGFVERLDSCSNSYTEEDIPEEYKII